MSTTRERPAPSPPPIEPVEDKPRGRIASIFTPKLLILAAVVAVVGWFGLMPLAYLLWGTFFDADGFTIDAFRRAYADTARLRELTYNSLAFAIGSTGLAIVVGTAVAFLTERTDVPFRRTLFAFSLVPIIIPGILYTIGWIFLASPRIGIYNAWLEPIFGPQFIDIFTMGGMIVAQGLDIAPLCFLLMVATFRSMDPSLEESAAMSGAGIWRIFFKITLPLARPGLFASVLIIGVRNLEAFETPALLGMPNGIWVFTSRIWRVLQSFPPDFAQAGAYSLSLLLLCSLGIYWHSRTTKHGKKYQTITGKGFRPGRMPLGRWRWPVSFGVMFYFFIGIFMPALVIFYMSVQPFYATPSMDSLSRLTLDNYAYVFNHNISMRAFRNSLVLGVGAATATMLLTAVASWIVVRTKIPGRWLLDNIALLPLIFPGLVLGVSLLFIYLRFPIPVYGTMWLLLIAYVTKFMPYGMRYASTSMHQIGQELEESAEMSGASWWQTFRRVTLPLLKPGFLAGWIYIMMISVRELSTSILLYSPGNEVLAVVIWGFWEDGFVTQLAALGSLMIGIMVVIALLAQRLGANVGVKA